MAYGKIVGHLIYISNPLLHLSVLEVASPQAYALVGMAATLAGVCQVPLTGWELKDGSSTAAPQEENSTSREPSEPSGSSIRELESSLCLNSDSEDDAENLVDEILVSQAMRTRYVTASMSSSLADVVSLMLEEKQSCASVVDDHGCLVVQLTLADIQQFSMARIRKPQVPRVSELCSYYGHSSTVSWTATPNMNLLTALTLMKRHGVSQLPVILEDGGRGGRLVGLLDRESINLACRVFAIRDGLSWFLMEEKLKN